MIKLLKQFLDEEGQNLIEYALLVVFLALASIPVQPTAKHSSASQTAR